MMLNLAREDEAALARLGEQLPGMQPASLAISALRLGLSALEGDPSLAARVGPGGVVAPKPKGR